MIDFNLDGFSDEELSDLAAAVSVEQKQRTRRPKLDAMDAQIAQLRKELPTASSIHDNRPRALLYSGGQLRESQACHCRTCLRAEINILQDRRKYLAEVNDVSGL